MKGGDSQIGGCDSYKSFLHKNSVFQRNVQHNKIIAISKPKSSSRSSQIVPNVDSYLGKAVIVVIVAIIVFWFSISNSTSTPYKIQPVEVTKDKRTGKNYRVIFVL